MGLVSGDVAAHLLAPVHLARQAALVGDQLPALTVLAACLVIRVVAWLLRACLAVWVGTP